MELKPRSMEIQITEEDLLTMERTRKWNSTDVWGLIPYIIMAIIQVIIGIRDRQLVCLCFALFTLTSLSTHIHQVYWYKEKQALFNVVCEKLSKLVKEEEK